jgi:hypothetical protein
MPDTNTKSPAERALLLLSSWLHHHEIDDMLAEWEEDAKAERASSFDEAEFLDDMLDDFWPAAREIVQAAQDAPAVHQGSGAPMDENPAEPLIDALEDALEALGGAVSDGRRGEVMLPADVSQRSRVLDVAWTALRALATFHEVTLARDTPNVDEDEDEVSLVIDRATGTIERAQ